MAKQFKKLGFSFLPIPEELMESKAISFGAKLLFGIIAKANLEKLEWPIQYLSKRMKCSDRQTSRRIKELKENNLILVIERDGKTSEYRVNLELINIIQSSDKNVTTPMTPVMSSHLRHKPCHHIKEPILKKYNKEGLLKFKKLKKSFSEKSRIKA